MMQNKSLSKIIDQSSIKDILKVGGSQITRILHLFIIYINNL